MVESLSKPKKILITGGSGFIGTNLVEHFLSRGDEVLNVDISEPKNKKHNQYWRQIDINNFEAFRDVVKMFNPDYIVHLAARTDLCGNVLSDYSTNISGMENLLKIISESLDLKKILIASSMLVCKTGYHPKDSFDYCPTTTYGRSKVETERMLWRYKPKCDWVIIRPTSIWGPWFDIPYKNFFDLIVSGLYFHIGNRSCVKTYGYVGNAVYQIEKILYADTINISSKVHYIGDYSPTNIEEWANEIADAIGKKIIKLPFALIRISALVGDFLVKSGIKFPMTSFRLKNMTTDNIIDLSSTVELAPNLPYSRIDGVHYTLSWMRMQKIKDE